MKKLLILAGVCSLLFAETALAAKPLSSLPNWSSSTSYGTSYFQVFLDSRYASDESVSKPEGGVKFELILTDKVTSSLTIKKVEYVNKTTKESHVVAGHSLLMPDGSSWTEYSLWLGHQWNLLGKWNVNVTTLSNGVFTYAFSITDTMLEQKTKPPRPDVEVKKNTDASGKLTGYTITATSSSLRDMKARVTVFEDNGDDILYRSSYSVPSTNTMQLTIPGCLTSSLGTDCDLSDNSSRIEVKNNDGAPTPWFVYVYSSAEQKTVTKAAPGRTIQNFCFPK